MHWASRRPSVHIPMTFMRLNALLTERLPGNIPLTRDLLKMLEAGDNVVTNDDAVRTFELPLLPLDDQLRRAAQEKEKGVGFHQPPDPDTNVGVVEALCRPDPGETRAARER